MAATGWKQLTEGWSGVDGDTGYLLDAYSEFVPPPRLGRKPYVGSTGDGGDDQLILTEDDPWGWHVTEYEQSYELDPGLARLGVQLVKTLVKLATDPDYHGIARAKLDRNPFWPKELVDSVGTLTHEHYLTLAPIALSRTQDHKGRLRWTLFGGSDQGPARGFWKSFFHAPGVERPADEALEFVRGLLRDVYDETENSLGDLRAAGFRILPMGEPIVDDWDEGPLPSWTTPFLWSSEESLEGVRYLLTFSPFGHLPTAVRAAYRAGELHLWPFPGSLLFWGAPHYLKLREQLPCAMQVPLQGQFGRYEQPSGIRVPQSGWLHVRRRSNEDQPKPPAATAAGSADKHGELRATAARSNRMLEEDKLGKLHKLLFSTDPVVMGLYGKPLARNVQLWNRRYELLLDGPQAQREDLKKAQATVERGGLFGYRFQYPAMRVGRSEVYWHRPLVAYLSPRTGEPAVCPDAPLGYLTAYDATAPDPARAVALWPRLLQRGPHLAALQLRTPPQSPVPNQATLNARKLLDAHRLLGSKPLPRSFARQLLTVAKTTPLEAWLTDLSTQAADAQAARLADELRRLIEPTLGTDHRRSRLPRPLTFTQTTRRSFELRYWDAIYELTERFVTKNNADCSLDRVTRKIVQHEGRDLDQLADYLIDHHTKIIEKKGMSGLALVGEVEFPWRTAFDYRWSAGWLGNQKGTLQERDLLVVVPGRDRSRAVLLCDHYDTAYMGDRYDRKRGGNGARLAAAGADDNHSATAALMLATSVFLDLSRQGKLGCDVWLAHLTGEEFPADCLGARYLTQRLVQGDLAMRVPDDGREVDLSGTRIQGVFVLDMIAHNNDRDQDVFQISPGGGAQSLWLAYQTHLANEIWNGNLKKWNARSDRQKARRGRRSLRGSLPPPTARHPRLSGEIRPPADPTSTLYNTDAQIFADAGIPVVLIMENYDINRYGYHDAHDTMMNIDLDFGAALAAIAIESAARVACEMPPTGAGGSSLVRG